MFVCARISTAAATVPFWWISGLSCGSIFALNVYWTGKARRCPAPPRPHAGGDHTLRFEASVRASLPDAPIVSVCRRRLCKGR